MSGRLVGEVYRNRTGLVAAGLTKPAAEVLAVLAESCRADRGDRMVSELHAYLAIAAVTSERSVSRHIRLLLQLGVLILVRRAGGRGRAGMPAVYQIADLAAWMTARGQVWVASGSEAIRVYGRADGGSIPIGGDRIDRPAGLTRHPDDVPIAPVGGSISDPLADQDPSTRHLGGDLPVVPGKTLGGTTEVTTGPREFVTEPPPAATPACKPSPRPRLQPVAVPATPAAASASPVDSRCGRPDCRAPGPCRACGEARRAEPPRVAGPLGEHPTLGPTAVRAAEAARAAAADLVAQRRAAIDACTLGCRQHGGYLGSRVCDHDPDRVARNARGLALVRDELRAARARRDATRRPAVPERLTATAGYGLDATDVATQPYGIPVVDPHRAVS